MASQDLKQRARVDEPNVKNGTTNENKNRRKGKMAMAKRGFRSLSVAVLLPLSLMVFSIYMASGHGHGHGHRHGHGFGSSPKPSWFPPVWALHLTRVASTIFMSLSAWLVWADGGFHKKPATLSLYLLALGLSLVWYPLVFGFGCTRIGLLAGLGELGAVAKCYRIFKEANPIAGDLVKPCLAWAAFMAAVNLKLLFI